MDDEKVRTALLIHCSREEAERIRAAAKRERRTISGYVINAVLSRLEYQSHVEKRLDRSLRETSAP
jgi:uncharacterized protein (DUF1778 family)